jgi:hypothetical protein
MKGIAGKSADVRWIQVRHAQPMLGSLNSPTAERPEPRRLSGREGCIRTTRSWVEHRRSQVVLAIVCQESNPSGFLRVLPDTVGACATLARRLNAWSARDPLAPFSTRRMRLIGRCGRHPHAVGEGDKRLATAHKCEHLDGLSSPCEPREGCESTSGRSGGCDVWACRRSKAGLGLRRTDTSTISLNRNACF